MASALISFLSGSSLPSYVVHLITIRTPLFMGLLVLITLKTSSFRMLKLCVSLRRQEVSPFLSSEPHSVSWVPDQPYFCSDPPHIGQLLTLSYQNSIKYLQKSSSFHFCLHLLISPRNQRGNKPIPLLPLSSILPLPQTSPSWPHGFLIYAFMST